MRQIVALLVPLLVLLPQPLAAQTLPYELDFAEAEPAATTPPAPAGNERLVDMAHQSPALASIDYGPFRVLDARRAALVGITDGDSVSAFEALLRDHPGIATLELVDCPGTEDDRANLRLGRMIRAMGIATHVPAHGFVASGAVELYLAGVRRSAETGAEFAVHSWEDDSGHAPADYGPDSPQNRAYLDYYRAMGMDEAQARAFYAMTNSVPFASAKWMTAREMDRWSRFEAAKPTMASPIPAPSNQSLAAAVPAPALGSARPRPASYGPFRMIDETRAAMVGATDARTPAAFEALLRDNPGIATIELIDCPGTEDDRANLRVGQMIRARGLATHVPANGWVASGAVDLFLAGTRRSADPSARFAVHSWEDYAGRGPQDYAPDAPKNRAYLDYYRAMGMSERGARDFYAMTNSTPFSRPRSLTTADMAQWTQIDWPTAPRAPLAQAQPIARGPALAAF